MLPSENMLITSFYEYVYTGTVVDKSRQYAY